MSTVLAFLVEPFTAFMSYQQFFPICFHIPTTVSYVLFFRLGADKNITVLNIVMKKITIFYILLNYNSFDMSSFLKTLSILPFKMLSILVLSCLSYYCYLKSISFFNPKIILVRTLNL